jgi:hypothetical protein
VAGINEANLNAATAATSTLPPIFNFRVTAMRQDAIAVELTLV